MFGLDLAACVAILFLFVLQLSFDDPADPENTTKVGMQMQNWTDKSANLIIYNPP